MLELNDLLKLFNNKEYVKYFYKDYYNIKYDFYKNIGKFIFNNELDKKSAYMEIKAGAGGCDAENCINILLKMYLKWALRKKFKFKLLYINKINKLQIKFVSIFFYSKFSYGWLKKESGIHRIIRKSPFNKNNRHTSFISVNVFPHIIRNNNIKIEKKDLKIQTFKSSGAGGQHVNKTNSAIRIQYIPKNITVTCQSSPSQYLNKKNAIKQLKSKLFHINKMKIKKKKNILKKQQTQISWSNQIRSYILDKSIIKDINSNKKFNKVNEILNGYLDRILISKYL